MKKLLAVFIALACVITCAFGLTACGDGGDGGTHTKHNWSATYTPDGDQHYQTCDGCDEKQYSDHDYGTSGVCVCGKTKPAAAHTSHNWSTTYTPDGDRHYQTCDGCNEKQYGNHDYGTSGVCVCGKQKPSDYVSVTGVTLNKTSLTLEINGSETLTATVLPDNATNKTVSWSSDKPAIAEVDSNGKVTAKADGTAVITATADGKSATCTVTVNKATTPTTNKYAEIVAALQARIAQQSYENAEILFIYETNSKLLACKFIMQDILYNATTRVSTNGYSLTTDIIDTSYYTTEIPKANLVVSSVSKGVYSSDGTADEQQMVSSMITKLLGDGYTIMYGTISATSNKGTDSILGDSAAFDVYALLEKDGSVFEYSETLTVTKELNDKYGDVYQTVLNSTEANKDSLYKCNNNVPTDLGEVAKLYLAECKKGQ